MKTEIQKKNNSKTLIKFPVLEGDSQIYLGQTIVTLVRMGIENNNTYSDETQHRFEVELMASVLSELDVTLDDLKKEYDGGITNIYYKCYSKTVFLQKYT